MRVAWVGGLTASGGVGGFARDLLAGLLRRDVAVTLFTLSDPKEQLEVLGSPKNLQMVHEPTHWHWGRWYSRHHLSIYLSSFAARAAAHRLLVRRLVEAHNRHPFDCVLQFSQTELLSMARRLDDLPPVVIFPCVHAAGELRWHRSESSYALQFERPWKHYAVRSSLVYRAWRQRRDLQRVAGQLGMSRRFNELMREDYSIPANRQAVVYQPVSPRHMPPSGEFAERTAGDDPVRLVFVGRLAVRKGIDLLVELSHRLDDLAGECSLEVAGGASFFSDYSGHLAQLNPRIAKHLGALDHQEVLRLFARSDLIVVPSKYEPGGIVLPEAIANGCAAVVSDEVGAAEPLSNNVCARFRSCNVEELEAQCRRMIARVRSEGQSLRHCATEEARARFDPADSAAQLEAALRLAGSGRAIEQAPAMPVPAEALFQGGAT